MHQKPSMLQIGIALVILLGCHAQARQIESWPYDRLKKEADLIVIGSAEKSEDSGELIPGLLWPTDFVGVNTIINVTGVLKSRFRQSQLTVFHLRLPDGKSLQDGPSMVQFRTGVLQIKSPGKITSLARPEYLLFLKKRKDGRYEPVSGPLESAYAIREVYLPTSGF